jgi:hypothetical protein
MKGELRDRGFLDLRSGRRLPSAAENVNFAWADPFSAVSSALPRYLLGRPFGRGIWPEPLWFAADLPHSKLRQYSVPARRVLP